MIKYDNLFAWYPGKFSVKKSILENCNFTLEKGAITGLVGLNGSGKTTLIRVMLGLSLFGKGSLWIDSSKMDSHVISEYLKVGYAPEVPNMSFNGSLKDLLIFIDLNKREKGTNGAGSEIKQIVKDFELSEYESQRFDQLSKGTKKRALTAISYIANPEFFILDEPFEGLDINQREILKSRLLNNKSDKYTLISSHELYELEGICDSYLHIADSKIECVDLNHFSRLNG